MKLKECPICGGELTPAVSDFDAHCGNAAVSKKIKILKCSECENEFDADENEADAIRKSAVREAKQKNIADTLSVMEKEASFSDVEQCFSLPARTLSKWKNGAKTPSAAAIALVNLIGVFPWLTLVAVNNYDPVTAYKIAMREVFAKATERDGVTAFLASNDCYDVAGLINSKTSDFVNGDNKLEHTVNCQNFFF